MTAQSTAVPSKLPVVIVISGTGSNMLQLANLSLSGELPIQINAVVSDRADATGLAAAAKLGFATSLVDRKLYVDRAAFDDALAATVASHAPQLVILAGFMRILGPTFVQRFADRMLNIHPSLLPKYRGLHTHQRAIEAGDVEHGASVHFVTEALDGGPVVIQARVPVLPSDTATSLAERVLLKEHQILPQAVRLFATGRLCARAGRVYIDGQELVTPVQV